MKELEPLEILERFKSEFSSDGYILGTQYDVEFSIIENALKQAEENENYANEIRNLHERNDRLCDRLDKQKAKICKLEKVIEIVKKKRVQIQVELSVNTYKRYCYELPLNEKNCLTEEEFNLLKEVFGNELR